MKPRLFPEQTKVLGKPAGMSNDECGPLPVYTDGTRCISKWELSAAEIQHIIKTGSIYVEVVAGQTQPPVLPHAFTPFVLRDESGAEWQNLDYIP